MDTTEASCKVDRNIKLSAADFLHEHGMTIAEYLRLAILYAAVEKRIPFPVVDTGVRRGRTPWKNIKPSERGVPAKPAAPAKPTGYAAPTVEDKEAA